MATTERVRFRKNDLIQGIEWATPLGNVTFKPKDNDLYNFDLSEDREFNMFIDNEFVEFGSAKWLVTMINDMIKKVLIYD